MAKIHILESNVYNQIAAGEVIESTASVVKELVENAIDAKATEITVKIERGGKSYIQVADNGTGIEESELPAVFLPHATSKIKVAKDLEKITTLGFRGEAVASIASVAKIEVRSKFESADMAYSLSCQGGEIGQIQPTALPCGTEITVENLFYNTPVRAKFLKTDRGEETDVTACMTKFILGHPEIAFLYLVDGKNKMQSYGGGLEEVLLSVYGKNILEDCVAIDAKMNSLSIRGYIGKANFTKANRTYQTTFINGRYVINSTVQMAVHRAYESYIMKRQYPFYMLFIDLPYDEVDVNVHPRKTDVRFANTNIIFSSIHKVISSVLDGTADAVNFLAKGTVESTPVTDILQNKSENTLQMQDNLLATEQEKFSFKESQEDSVSKSIAEIQGIRQEKKTTFDALDRIEKKYQGMQKEGTISDLFTKLSGHKSIESLTFQDSGQYYDESTVQSNTALQNLSVDNQDWKKFKDTLKSGQSHQENFLQEIDTKNQAVDRTIESINFNLQSMPQKEQQRIFLAQAKYIGSIFQTYLLYSLENEFYIIDQHAAHERLLFDKLCAKMKSREILSQSMLVPYIVHVNTEENFFLEENATHLQELGFEISKFGEKTFRVESVASDLYNIDLKKFFMEIFGKIGQFKGIQFVDLFREKLAMMACKAAVKGGQQLTQTEVDALFAMLAGDIGLKCPHGRPIAIRFTKTEIEKLFKRIV